MAEGLFIHFCPVYRNTTGCLLALFPLGLGGLACSMDHGLYFFSKKTRGSLFPTVPSDEANKRRKENNKQK